MSEKIPAQNNLVSIGSHDAVRRKEISAMGAQKSAEVRAKKATFRDAFGTLLSTTIDIGVMPDKVQEWVDAEKISAQDGIALMMIYRAIKGDVRAAEYVRDTLGEKPTDRKDGIGGINITVTVEDKKPAPIQVEGYTVDS